MESCPATYGAILGKLLNLSELTSSSIKRSIRIHFINSLNRCLLSVLYVQCCVRHRKYVVNITRHGFCPHGAYCLEGKPATKQRSTELGIQLQPWLTGGWWSVPVGDQKTSLGSDDRVEAGGRGREYLGKRSRKFSILGKGMCKDAMVPKAGHTQGGQRGKRGGGG